MGKTWDGAKGEWVMVEGIDMLASVDKPKKVSVDEGDSIISRIRTVIFRADQGSPYNRQGGEAEWLHGYLIGAGQVADRDDKVITQGVPGGPTGPLRTRRGPLRSSPDRALYI